MTTRRERIMARLEKRRAWRESALAESGRRWNAALSATAGIPLGQPILVGHHSERRHRNALARAQSNATKACEASDRASDHASKAANIEHALDRTIFSDDPDAIESLKARIAGLEAEREEQRRLGAAWRKAKRPASADVEGWRRVCALMGWEWGSRACVRAIRDCASEDYGCKRGPVPSYVLSNLGGNISRLRKRVEEIKRQNAKQAECEAAGGLLIDRYPSGYCRVRFSDYPGREVVSALKSAGFSWGGGAWSGKESDIPGVVRARKAVSP